jgi:Amidase
MEPRADDSGLVPLPVAAAGDGTPRDGGRGGRGHGGVAAAAVERALQVVDEREAVVRAWAYLDRARARAEARAVDASLRASSSPRPLAGMVLGVKDVFDTADQPTEYGSPIFAGFRPRADAGAVQLLRSSGAVCLGPPHPRSLAAIIRRPSPRMDEAPGITAILSSIWSPAAEDLFQDTIAGRSSNPRARRKPSRLIRPAPTPLQGVTLDV